MDIYKPLLNKTATQSQLVRTGRIVALIALVIAIAAAEPLLGQLDQAFQYIQEFTGFVSPGILALFLLGLFWKKGTANAALWSAIVSVPFSVLFKTYLPQVPFMNRMGLVLILCCLVLVVISLIEGKGKDHPKAVEMEEGLFHTSAAFNVGAVVICVALAIIYTVFY